MKNYVVTKSYHDAPENPITITKGELLTAIEQSNHQGNWPNWVHCKGTEKQGWVPKQILKIEGDLVTVLEDYTAREHNLEVDLQLVALTELNGWIWGYKTSEPDVLGWAPLNHLSEL